MLSICCSKVSYSLNRRLPEPNVDDKNGKEALIRLCDKNDKFTSKNNGQYARHEDEGRAATEDDKVLDSFKIIKKDLEESIKKL